MKTKDADLMNKTHKKYGYVPINIEIVKNNVGELSILQFIHDYSTANFQMIESSAYFESYIHVLKSLKKMDTWDRLPFHELIVNGEKDRTFTAPYMS